MPITYTPPEPLIGPRLGSDTSLFACVANAFADLSEQGYFARSNLGASLSDGLALVPRTRRDAFAFYHAQDTNTARGTGCLSIAWSGDAATVRAALERNYLDVEHDGSLKTRFSVSLRCDY